jgi:hypothetical protein
MNLHQMQIKAFALEAAGSSAQALSTPCTLTLHLPAAAQASPPGERPMGSIIKLEIDGKPVTKHSLAQTPAPAPFVRPALLTLTF